MKKRRILAILLTLTTLLGLTTFLPGTVFAAEQITVVVNGETVQFPDVQPFTDKNGRTFVPVRFITEEMDCKVDWIGATHTVTIDRGKVHVELIIGEKEITVMGVKKTMDTAAQEQGGRTLVPIRFVAEAFGCDVVWTGATKTVAITDSGKDVYKIGTFDVEIEEDDSLSTSPFGLVVNKISGVIVREGRDSGKPVLDLMAIIDVPGADVEKQRVEIDALLKQCLNAELADEVLAYVENIKEFSDIAELKVWEEGRFRVSASGGSGIIAILVYIG